MKMIPSMAMASAIALSVLAFSGLEAAKAGPIVPPGHACIQYDYGGTDCGFTSYSQCEATASGLAAECFASPIQDDRQFDSRAHGPHAKYHHFDRQPLVGAYRSF